MTIRLKVAQTQASAQDTGAYRWRGRCQSGLSQRLERLRACNGLLPFCGHASRQEQRYTCDTEQLVTHWSLLASGVTRAGRSLPRNRAPRAGCALSDCECACRSSGCRPCAPHGGLLVSRGALLSGRGDLSCAPDALTDSARWSYADASQPDASANGQVFCCKSTAFRPLCVCSTVVWSPCACMCAAYVSVLMSVLSTYSY